MTRLVLVAPLQGWSAPLEEVPDAVFADRLLGDGVAIDPTGATLHAPCDGEIITIPPQKHAVTLRAANGAEILLHVGIDTVALGGEGFRLHVAAGSKVKAGEPLLTFDLDLLARRAKSLLTPIIVTDGVPFSVVRRTTDRAVVVGDFLMELAPASARAQTGSSPAETEISARVIVPLEHGLHARPAALLASRIKTLSATVTIDLAGRSANARSAIALMSLGVHKGDEVTIRAAGPDAAAAVKALEVAIRTAVEEVSPGKSVHGANRAAHVARGDLGGRVDAIKSVTAATITDSDRSVIRGVTASPGLASGVSFRLALAEIRVVEEGAGVTEEGARLHDALGAVRRKLEEVVATARGPSRDVAGAHLEFLDDPELTAVARGSIARGKGAGFAWRQAVRASVDVLRALPDVRMAERAADLLDLESQVLTALDAKPVADGATTSLPDRAIVLADELLPSQFIALDAARLAGICTAGGGPTSHVAILAAALDIPMLVAAGPRLGEIRDGAPLVLDADRGLLHIAPTPSDLAAAETAVADRRSRRADEKNAAQRECRTADGVRIEVFANAGSVAEAEAAVAQGAEGCGLLRTEFLFLGRDSAPDEAAQAAQYQAIVAAFAGRPVIIRTLDVGGDKPLTYLPLPREDNPALGLRGVRVSLRYPEMLQTQLRAILRVQPQGRCRILLPMVSDPAEVRAVRQALDVARNEVGHQAPVLLGAMIETPSSAVLADQIAREADFLSIGTNDLTQYALAMDRGNPALAARLDALHPAVLRLIATAARAARARGRDIAVCGGLASDPSAAPILIGLGVNELSAVPAAVPRVKALIRALTLDACTALANQAMEEDSAGSVRALVSQWLAERHLVTL